MIHFLDSSPEDAFLFHSLIKERAQSFAQPFLILSLILDIVFYPFRAID